jgi:hypothetical protein
MAASRITLIATTDDMVMIMFFPPEQKFVAP